MSATGRITLIKRYTRDAREQCGKPQRYQRAFTGPDAETKAKAAYERWWADLDVKAVWYIDVDHPENDDHRNLSTHPRGHQP